MKRIFLRQTVVFRDDIREMQLRVSNLLETRDGSVYISGERLNTGWSGTVCMTLKLEKDGHPDLGAIRGIVDRGNGIESVDIKSLR